MSQTRRAPDSEELRDEHLRALRRLAAEDGTLGAVARELITEQEDRDER